MQARHSRTLRMFGVYQGIAIIAYLACLNIHTVSGENEGCTQRNCKYLKDGTIYPLEPPLSVYSAKSSIKCLDKGCRANATIVTYNTSDSSCSLYDGRTESVGNQFEGVAVYIRSEDANKHHAIGSESTIGMEPVAPTHSTTLAVIDRDSIADVDLLPTTFGTDETLYGAWNLFDGKKTKAECEKYLAGAAAMVHSTAEVDRPHIVITLISIHNITGVKLWNRDRNPYGNRTENMEVRVSITADFSDPATLCDRYPGIMIEPVHVFICQSGYITGQHIRLLLDKNPATLNLYEAELYHV